MDNVEKLLKPQIGWPLLLLIWYSIMPFGKNFYNPMLEMALNQFVEEPNGNSRLVHYGLEMNIGLILRKVWFLEAGLFTYITMLLFKARANYLRSKKAIIASLTALALLLTAIPSAAVSAKPQSQGLIWSRDLVNQMTKLNVQALENMEENDRSINGKISSMDLEIGPEMGDILNYKVKLKISDVFDKEITFTLHRSLEIHNVKINASDINSFKRINDWIIFDKHPVGTVQVEFNVSGKLPVSLGEVTDRTLMLTQDSPWYPVLGKHKVLSPISDYGYLTNNLCGSEKYEINIISQRGDIITNLSPQKGD